MIVPTDAQTIWKENLHISAERSIQLVDGKLHKHGQRKLFHQILKATGKHIQGHHSDICLQMLKHRPTIYEYLLMLDTHQICHIPPTTNE